jgi:flagellar biosynthetic protein FliR
VGDSVVDPVELYSIPGKLVQNLDLAWSFLLLMTRFSALVMFTPGIGSGMSGIAVRYPAVLLLAAASLKIAAPTPVPPDIAIMATQILCEFILGSAVATVPLLIVTGAAAAGQIASNSIGLNGAQMFDPTTNASTSDLSRIYGDLTVILFLLLNGHHVAIAHLSMMSEVIQPGSFLISGAGIESLIILSGKIFEIGVMVASPVIVALFLANFVMGLLSKMVSSFNVFMMSFYITIGIGFILSLLALPELMEFMKRYILQIEPLIQATTR